MLRDLTRNEIHQVLAEALGRDTLDRCERDPFTLAEEVMDHLNDNGIIITLTVKEI